MGTYKHRETSGPRETVEATRRDAKQHHLGNHRSIDYYMKGIKLHKISISMDADPPNASRPAKLTQFICCNKV